jgi:opacity protein-like surface antigen
MHVRPHSLLAATAAALLASAPLSAQRATPSATRAGDPTGFVVHGHVEGAQLDPEVDGETEYGFGAGAQLGYNLTRYVGVFGGVDVARMRLSDEGLEAGEDAPRYDFTHLEAGARLNLPIGQRLLPYVDVGYARRQAEFDQSDEFGEAKVRLKGDGAVAGGGFQLFVTPSVAVDLGARLSFGDLDDFEAEIDGETLDAADFEELFGEPFTGSKVTFSRLTLGLTWYPGSGAPRR